MKRRMNKTKTYYLHTLSSFKFMVSIILISKSFNVKVLMLLINITITKWLLFSGSILCSYVCKKQYFIRIQGIKNIGLFQKVRTDFY